MINITMDQVNNFDLALVMCPAWGATQPPVGISYLKSFLKNSGVRVKCFDFNLELYKVFPEKKYWDLNYPEHFITPCLFEKDILPVLSRFVNIWVEQILKHNPLTVGFSLFMSSMNSSLLLAKRLKEIKPDLVILGGGPEVTRMKRVLSDGLRGFAPINDKFKQNNCFDFLVEGEGEKTLSEILTLIKQRKEFHNTKGLIYKNADNLIVNAPREPLLDLDILPPPNYDDFSLVSYTRNSLPFVTSRGCINRCSFCADSPLWKVYRYRSAQKVFEEMIFLSERYGRNEFEIVDSMFNGDIQRIDELCNLIISSKLRIRWSAKVGLRKEMSYDLLRKMNEAGCNSLAYGVESGSPRVLKDMRKNTDINEVKMIIKDTCRAGIQANCFFIIGYPTETEGDFQMTLDFIKENAEFIYRFDQVTGCHIEEDSYLGLNLEKYGIIFKEDGWHTKDSTPEIRGKRLALFRGLARQLHKHYQCEVQS